MEWKKINDPTAALGTGDIPILVFAPLPLGPHSPMAAHRTVVVADPFLYILVRDIIINEQKQPQIPAASENPVNDLLDTMMPPIAEEPKPTDDVLPGPKEFSFYDRMNGKGNLN